MLINEAKKFAFVHVPKTGGVSLSNPLAWFCDVSAPRFYRGPIRREEMNQIQLRTYERHLTAAEISAHLARGQWGKIESFGIVRDPLERIMSHFGYVRRLKDHPNHAQMRDLDTPEKYVAEIGRRVHLRPQVHYLAGVKHVYRFEELGTCFAHMVSVLMCRGEVADRPPFLNRSAHPLWDDVFGGNDLPAPVAKFIEQDLTLYNRLVGRVGPIEFLNA